MLAFPAIILSQLLIITNWTDAKFGTLVNILLLLTIIPAYAKSNFNKKPKEESAIILARSAGYKGLTVKNEMLDSLPDPVQHWLNHSGIIGKNVINTVRLRQQGEMRTKPEGNWMPFQAE